MEWDREWDRLCQQMFSGEQIEFSASEASWLLACQ